MKSAVKNLSIGLLFLMTTGLPFKAEATLDRGAAMTTASVINLLLLGTVSWQASNRELPEPYAGEAFLPDYNISPNDPENILLRKMADARVDLHFFQNIRNMPYATFTQYLRCYEESSEKDDASHKISREIMLYLVKRQARRANSWGAPYLEARGETGYHYTNSPNRPVPQTDGSVNPVLQLKEGRFSESGHAGWAGVDLRGGLAPWFSYEFEPLGLFASNDAGRQKHAEFRVQRGYGKFNVNSFEIELGRDTVQWGFGREGTMMFSGNAQPFWQIRFGNSVPVKLPGPFVFLGPTRTSFFFALLNGNDDFPNSILQGSTTTFMPHPRVEFAVLQSVQFGGDGSDSWNPLNFFADEGLTNDKDVNRNFGLNIRFRIPVIEIEPYAELLWEDCCANNPVNTRDMLNLLGLSIPNIGPSDKADLAVEWARTNDITYRHSRYTSGFYYQGFAIGHPIGRDGDGIYGIFRYFHSPTLWGKAVFAWEQRRNEGSPSEDRYRIQGNIYHEFNRHIRVLWEAAYERVIRFNFTDGDNRNNYFAGFALEIS